jgi:phage portal protein BeeE
MWNVPSSLLSTERDDRGALCWVLGDSQGSERVIFDRDGRAQVGPVRYRLVVLRNPHSPVDADGNSQGVFAMSPGVYGLAAQIDSYAQGTFRTGVPAGYLKVQTPGLTQEAAVKLRSGWMAAHGGDRRSIAVLNATTDFQPLQLSPVDAALDSVKRLNLADVAFSFGLDPMTLGAGLQNSATYTNLRDAWANHKDFGLAPWTAAVEGTLSALMPGTQSVRVNLDGFANPTPAERFSAWQTALDAGIVTVAEVRAAEGLPPLPDGQPSAATESATPEEGAPDA